MSNWLDDYYRDADALDMDALLSHHTDDAVVQFGNNPPAVGKEQIAAAIGGLWGAISGMAHTKKNVWHVEDDTTVLEAIVEYTTHGGTGVPLPVTSILHRADDKVDNLRVYIDLAPLFEAVEAESAA